MGFEASDFEDDEGLEVWPENWQAVSIFSRLQTQWAVGGMSGRLVGLRYEAIEPVCRLSGVKKRHRPALFDALRVMEEAAMAVLNARKGG
jgi:hypothetical protein